jgi:hypothetical protein
MSNTNTCGPAFPTTVRTHYSEDTGSTWSEHIDPGMTLRDYFAAKALQGLVSAWGGHDVTDFDELASDAYNMADAMLKAREQ